MHEFKISARLRSWFEIDVQRYSIKPILQVIFSNLLSVHFFMKVLTVLTSLSTGFEKWWHELKNSRTISKLEKSHESFWIKSLNLYCIVFCWGCQVWSRYLQMPELFCLQYDLPWVPHIQTWNTCQQQLRTVCFKVWCTLNHSSNSQMALWSRICCKVYSYYIVAWYLHYSRPEDTGSSSKYSLAGT